MNFLEKERVEEEKKAIRNKGLATGFVLFIIGLILGVIIGSALG